MIILLSPSKTLDFETKLENLDRTELQFAREASYLAAKLKSLNPARIAKMMDLSNNLSRLNFERFQAWQFPLKQEDSRQAIFAFKGDVYLGLDANSFTKEDLRFAQNHLQILSGLYGMLRPLDAILPYRLEMGAEFAVTPKQKNLYLYWRTKLTSFTKTCLQETSQKWILNLASQEYSKAVDLKALGVPVVTPEFKEERDAKFQMISFFAKKARGLMAAYAIRNKIQNPEDLLNFNAEGYALNASLSDLKTNQWVFTRKSK